MLILQCVGNNVGHYEKQMNLAITGVLDPKFLYGKWETAT